MPPALRLARLCQEFHIDPVRALQLDQETPPGWIDRVLEARAFAEAKILVDGTQDRKHLPESPWIDWVHETELAVAAEDIARDRSERREG